MRTVLNQAAVEAAARQFCLDAEPRRIEAYGNGHINDTFLVETDAENYILQRINHEVFKNPEGLMRNIYGVTEFLKKKLLERGGDPKRETLNLILTVDGAVYYRDEDGNYWRTYRFIEDTESYDIIRDKMDFYRSGQSFGNFQRLLADYPAAELVETIPRFHHTISRYEAFEAAVAADSCGRTASVAEEIAFVRARREEIYRMTEHFAEALPLRVTHNDTKMNNILMDRQSGRALCIIDLDTVMPGYSIFDFGDSIRFGASTALEDEVDLSKVSMSLELFELYTKGFLEGTAGSLTEEEKRQLPMGAKMMTLECGIRFLTDYLSGDTYFRIHRPGHNLDRARTQFTLVADMEQKWAQMQAIVQKF